MGKKRTVPGMVTMVGMNLRIINGNIDSLRKLRKPGRPRKFASLLELEEVVVVEGSAFPDKTELRESGMRDGFRLVRHRKRWIHIAERNRTLQARFDELCSEVRILDPFSWEYSEVQERLNSGKVSKIEKSIPGSFCSCSANTADEEMSCTVHGFKRDDCSCAGVNGITGYRMCGGHRATGHIAGIVPFMTERMKVSKEDADNHARTIGWM